MNEAFLHPKAGLTIGALSCALALSALLAVQASGSLVRPLSSTSRAIASSQINNDLRPLEQGKPIERELVEGQTHTYQVTLSTGQFLHVLIRQRGASVAAKLFAPDGKELLQTASLLTTQVSEEALWLSQIAASPGQYRIELRSAIKGAPPGRYQILLEEQREATPQDEIRLEAQRAFSEARLLALQGSKESLDAALKKYADALSQFQTGERKAEELVTLSCIGSVYSIVRDGPKTIEYYQRALASYRADKNLYGEAFILNRMGRVYAILFSQYDKAIDLHQLALDRSRLVRYRVGELTSLRHLGNTHWFQSEFGKVKEYYERGLAIAREVRDRLGERRTLYNLGLVYGSLNQPEKSAEYYQQALALAREAGDRGIEGDSLQGLGNTYTSLAQIEKAINHYEQALVVQRAARNAAGEANSLIGLGNCYAELSLYQKSLEYYLQSMEINRALKSPASLGSGLVYVGAAYYLLHEYEKAIEAYEQSLAIAREVKNPTREGDSLIGLASAFQALTRFDKAIEFFTQALAIKRQVKEYDGEARALIGLGDAYYSQNQFDKAISHHYQALSIKRRIKEPAGEAYTLNNLMRDWRQTQPRIAIFYGKRAINAFQRIRRDIKGLDKESREAFLKSNESAYRMLADLLISEGRLAEAQQVVDMLKEEEYFDFVRRDLRLGESKASSEYRADEVKVKVKEGIVTTIGARLGELDAKAMRATLTAEEEQLRVVYVKRLETAEQDFQSALAALAKEVRHPDKSAAELSREIEDERGLMEDLRELGSGVIALYTFVFEDRYSVILMTPTTRVLREYPIRSADLNKKIAAFREALQDPEVDPLPASQELYRILIAPVARDLEGARSKPNQTLTLMWQLDGVLRYVPIAALHDGEKYLVERFRNVIYTPASKTRLKDSVTAHWRGLGLGVSKEHKVEEGTFPALPAVPDELRSVIRDDNPKAAHSARQPGTRGVLPGRVFLDEAFKIAALQSARQRYQLVHIASHFQLKTGDETKSYLLLGDGKPYTLAQFRTSGMLFSGVDLLTLSACNTAMGNTDASGKEIEGFGVMAQRQGAKAVVASLWPIVDESTRVLMQEFYRLRESKLGTSKAEALRQAQLALLHGSTRFPHPAPRGLAVKPVDKRTPAPYAHPYYWAPFILIGNWK